MTLLNTNRACPHRQGGAMHPTHLNHSPSALNHQPSTLNPQPSTFNPQPSTLNPQPSTLDPRRLGRSRSRRLSTTGAMASGSTPAPQERDFFIDNLLVRIHFIIEMIGWPGLAPWGFEFPFPGSLVSTLLNPKLLTPNPEP